MKNNIQKAVNVLSAAAMVQLAVAKGLAIVKASRQEEEWDIGPYKVITQSRPEMMQGLNLFAQTRCMVNGKAYVTVDGLFDMMPESVRKSVLAHEVGHLVQEDGTPKNLWLYFFKRYMGICPKEEKVADSFSTKLFGADKTKAMLKWIFFVSPGPEIVQRWLAVK